MSACNPCGWAEIGRWEGIGLSSVFLQHRLPPRPERARRATRCYRRCALGHHLRTESPDEPHPNARPGRTGRADGHHGARDRGLWRLLGDDVNRRQAVRHDFERHDRGHGHQGRRGTSPRHASCEPPRAAQGRAPRDPSCAQGRGGSGHDNRAAPAPTTTAAPPPPPTTSAPAPAPAPAPTTTTTAAPPPPTGNGIPQGNGGDADGDNNGGPSDGDGLI